jgi:phosphomannomutase
MRRRLLAFDLDDTLAVTKSPISDAMADLLGRALALYDVCVISGGAFPQFQSQLIDRLDTGKSELARLHLMPTSGTRYFRFNQPTVSWIQQYAEDLSELEKKQITTVLTNGAKALGLWEDSPHGDIIEDRGSQITYSALGQQAPAAVKYLWDRDGSKKEALRHYAAEHLPNLSVRAGGSTSVDVTRQGIDKAYGVRRMMAVLGLTPNDVLFFGDQLNEGGNDYPVKSVGIDTIAVRDSTDTLLALEAILAVSSRFSLLWGQKGMRDRQRLSAEL